MAGPQTLQAKPGYVEVEVAVRDSSGHDVPNLTKDDFVVSVDDASQPIEFFRADVVEKPEVGILVDTSGSTATKLPAIKSLVVDLVRNLAPGQKVFMIGFAARPVAVQSPTDDHAQVLKKLDILGSRGETRLYDSIGVALLAVSLTCSPSGIVVVITDGLDSKSSSHAGDIATEAGARGVKLDLIGVGNSEAANGHRSNKEAILESEDLDYVDVKALQQLALETGGSFERVRSDADGDALNAAALKLSLSSRVRYTVGFVLPDTGGHPWGRLSIKVLNHPDATAYTKPLVPRPIPDAASTAQGFDLTGTYGGEIANMNGVQPLVLETESRVAENGVNVTGDWKTNAATLGNMSGTLNGNQLSFRIDRGDACRGSFQGVGTVTDGGKRVRGELKGRDCTLITDWMFDVSKRPN